MNTLTMGTHLGWTLRSLQNVLTELGYDATLNDESISLKINEQFPLVITENDGEFTFSCQVAELADVPDDDLAKFALAALDANQRIRPFAFSILTDGDGETIPVVLIDSIPTLDLDRSEVDRIMLKLHSALISSRLVFEVSNIGIEAAV